jgi:hypothetical protein
MIKRYLVILSSLTLLGIITPIGATAVSLDSSTQTCLTKAIGKAATQKILKAKKLTASQQKSVNACKTSRRGSTTQPTSEPWYFEQSNWDYKTALPREPKCTESYPLKVLPAPIETIVQLNRLGYSQPGAHAMPVPHHNIYTRDLRGTGTTDENGKLLVSARIDPLIAPGNLTIIAMAQNVYSRNTTTLEVYSYEEWMIAMHVCGTKYIVFNHVDDIPASWVTATKQATRQECIPGQDNARVCMYEGLKIAVKQGERVGRASGRSGGWDLGGWDTSRPTPGVMDPGKYTGRWATGACAWDWFTPSLRDAMFAKFIGDKTTCGTHGHDVVNTLSGVWLAVGLRSKAFSEDLHVALHPSPKNDGTYRFSIGFSSNISSLAGGIYEFQGATSGLRNPMFTSVAPGQVACFDTFDSSYTFDKSVTKIYASMTAGDTERLTIAGATGGGCGSGPYTMPSGSQVFERRTRTTG